MFENDIKNKSNADVQKCLLSTCPQLKKTTGIYKPVCLKLYQLDHYSGLALTSSITGIKQFRGEKRVPESSLYMCSIFTINKHQQSAAR